MEEIQKNISSPNSRERIFTPSITLWAFLSQVMDDDSSQQSAVTRIIAAAISSRGKTPSPNTSAYSQARSRLPENGLKALTQTTANTIVSGTPSKWLWKGKHIKLVDGSTLSMPDTKENQATYPQPKSQKEGVGFPLMRIVAIVDYISGVVLDLAYSQNSGKETGEHALLRELMPCISENDILLGDCYYPSFFLMATLKKQGISGVFPAHKSRKYDFRRGQRLGKKDHIVEWKKPKKPKWMKQVDYDDFPDEISIREISTEIKKTGFRTKTRVLVTTFLDPKEVNNSDLANLYECRWFVELTFRSIKETMRMDILRGKTPSMVHKEIWVHLLAYNLIRKIMAQSAWLYERLPTTISFKLALQTIRAFRQAGVINIDDPDIYIKLLNTICYKTVGNRPDRLEPRYIKRRAKPFPRLQKPRNQYENAA